MAHLRLRTRRAERATEVALVESRWWKNPSAQPPRHSELKSASCCPRVDIPGGEVSQRFPTQPATWLLAGTPQGTTLASGARRAHQYWPAHPRARRRTLVRPSARHLGNYFRVANLRWLVTRSTGIDNGGLTRTIQAVEHGAGSRQAETGSAGIDHF